MFKGTYTAIVTPFTANGELDKPAFEKLVKLQLDGGVDGIVPCGTTGETPTLSEEEKDWIIRTTVTLAKGKAKVIAGTGSNSTHHTIANTKKAKELGADAALVVVPYYNKPTQEGLYRHFRAVAEQGGLPIMLYNVPGRTSCDLQADTVVRLQADLPNVVAIKEAAGSTDRVGELRARTRKDFAILSGDDSLTLPMMAVGADGVVSVASNVYPAKVVGMVRAAQQGDYSKAREIHFQLRTLFSGLFVEANPVPCKAALQQLGHCTDVVRLPLVAASDKTRDLLREILKTI